MDAVNLSFRYVESDYVRALRTHYASRLRLPLDIILIVGLTSLAIYEVRSRSLWFGIALFVVCGLFALMLIAAFTVVPRIAFRNQPQFRDDYSLVFSQQGIHFRTTHINSELQWQMYTHAVVD